MDVVGTVSVRTTTVDVNDRKRLPEQPKTNRRKIAATRRFYLFGVSGNTGETFSRKIVRPPKHRATFRTNKRRTKKKKKELPNETICIVAIMVLLVFRRFRIRPENVRLRTNNGHISDIAVDFRYGRFVLQLGNPNGRIRYANHRQPVRRYYAQNARVRSARKQITPPSPGHV